MTSAAESPLHNRNLELEMQEEGESSMIKTKKPKKRKREKKEEEIHATIKQIREEPDKIPPIVAYFPCGYNPIIEASPSQHSNERKHDKKSDRSREPPPKIEVYRNAAESKSKRLQVVVSPPNANVQFVGSNYGGEGATRQVCVYTLGILDKETQTLKIVPIASNKIFRLEPRIKSLDLEKNEDFIVEEKADLDDAAKKADRIKQITKLNNLYGTKRSISQAKKRQAMKQENDPESQKILDGKFKEAEIKHDALESTSCLVSRNIPPHDTSATTPELAYPLGKIILKGDWDFLEDIYMHLEEGKLPPDGHLTYVCNRFHDLERIKDEADQKTNACILAFINHLIKFKDLHSMDAYSSAKRHKIPSIIRNRLTSMFSDPDSKRLQTEKLNLLISYVLVLTLYVDGFRTNPTDIAKDLRMSSVMLRSHYENLGCKLKKDKGMLIATLPLPLKFPDIMMRRRR